MSDNLATFVHVIWIVAALLIGSTCPLLVATLVVKRPTTREALICYALLAVIFGAIFSAIALLLEGHYLLGLALIALVGLGLM